MVKLYRFIKPFTVSIAAVLLLVFLQTLAELSLPTLMADIVDIGIVDGNTGYIMKIGGLMLLVTAVGTFCAIAAGFLSARVSAGFGRLLRGKVFSRVESFSLQRFNEIGTATMITRTTNDINQVQSVTFTILRMMVGAPIMCLGGIIMAVSQDRPLSLCIVAVIPVIVALIAVIVSKAMPLFKLMQIKLDKINLVMRENLTGIRVIRAFNRIERERRRFAEANYDLCQNAIRVNKLMASLMPSMMLVMNFTIIAIIWFGGVRIDNGDMQVGSLMAFIQYAMQIMTSLVNMSMMFVMLPRASASALRINEIVEADPEIRDPEEPRGVDKGFGLVEFKNVSFSFPGAEEPALSNISFTARPGETTAVIGGTGSGKTSLVNLIPRFYDVDRGSVMVDGTDVREMTQKNLRAKIALVPQKAVLFTGSISDNIRYGKQDASDEEVRRAAEISQAMEFISGMPGGFDAVIEQGGGNVSGGQKQRLAIARALVRRPEIYIFDDSFSALDFKTDARLRAALKKETADATVIVIAQRVATVMDADQIIVLENGRTVGQGTHKELLASCAIYQEIVYSQLSEEELA